MGIQSWASKTIGKLVGKDLADIPAEAPHSEGRAAAEAKAKENAELRAKKTAEADIVREGEHPKRRNKKS